MSMQLLASGPGWRVEDVVCSAGPRDRPFEEQHDLVCVAAVTRGTFEYWTPDGRATLVPGALMLGNPGACFECGHEHGVGDRCLSFHYDPGFFEEIVASVPRARRSVGPKKGRSGALMTASALFTHLVGASGIEPPTTTMSR